MKFSAYAGDAGSVELLSVSIMSRPFLWDRSERPVAADEKETIPILIPFSDELRASRLVGPVAVRYLFVRQQLWAWRTRPARVPLRQ